MCIATAKLPVFRRIEGWKTAVIIRPAVSSKPDKKALPSMPAFSISLLTSRNPLISKSNGFEKKISGFLPGISADPESPGVSLLTINPCDSAARITSAVLLAYSSVLTPCHLPLRDLASIL